MNYCSNCGSSLTLAIPPGEDRERHWCRHCGSIHYLNPRIIVGCIPIWQGKILLCKRGIEPRLGYWTLPAGFMELGETTEQGAIRETWEETRARVDIDHLHGIYNIPHINQVYLIYRARMKTADFETTPESTQVELVDPAEIPWEQLAFRVMNRVLKEHTRGIPADHTAGLFHGTIEKPR